MRLIDADALPKLLDAEYKQTMKLIRKGEKHLDTLAEGFAEASHIAKYIAATVDAAPVVRCKDCRKFKTYACRMVASGYDDFCSYGERKGGETDGS